MSATLFTALLFAALVWGALSFGAVYPWAYQPLLAVATGLGLWGIFFPTSHRRLNLSVLTGVSLILAAIGLQLVPLSRDTLVGLSPAADAFLLQNDFAYAALVASGATVVHPLSIRPVDTQLGLLLVAALGTFLVGLQRTLDGIMLRTLLPRLTGFGVVLALIGIIQKPMFTGKIYGFWTPEQGTILYSPGGGPFGPFVNRNHFAGWMLMGLPLVIGYFCALLAKAMPEHKKDWRDRILWFSSPDANQTTLVGFAILIMGLSLVITLSRSGITCFMISLALSGIAVIRGRTGRSTRAFALSYLLFVAVLTASWAGLDAVATRFQLVDRTLEGRLFVWQDALRLYDAFPLTGSGLSTYGAAMLTYQTFQTDLFHFAQAHNDYLQLLAEGGLLLVTPTLLAVALFAREVWRRFREGRDDVTGYWLRLGAVTGLISISLQSIVEFSLRMPGNALLFVLLCGIAVRETSGRGHRIATARNR